MSSFSRSDAVQDNLLAGGYKFATSICYEMEYPMSYARIFMTTRNLL